MKKQVLRLFLGFLGLMGCHSKDAVTPVGVSTFISRDDIKKQLGFDFSPQSLAFDPGGNLYVADYYRIIKITPDGSITRFAGDLPGYKNGLVPTAMFNGIQGLAFDQQGNLYIGEQHNTCIRKVTPDGRVSLFAGRPNWTFLPGYDGPDDGPDSSAHVASPTALAVDPSGNLLETESGFVSRYSADALRRITPAGSVKTIVGNAGLTEAGNFADQPAYFQYPSGLALGSGDTVYVSDRDNALIRAVSPNGRVTTVAGNGKRAVFDGPGKQAGFMVPTALAYSPAHGLYIADGAQIRLRTADGLISSPVGTAERGYRDGSLKEARFGLVSAMAFNAVGVLYLNDSDNGCIRRVRFF